MPENGNWTVSLGRIGQIRIRLHIFFLLFAVFGFFLTQQLVPRQDADGMLENTLLLFGLLFVSVLLHEFGHIQAALRLGGKVERIVIGPLGGLDSPEVHPSPRNILLVAIAGPLVNLAVCLAMAGILWFLGEFDLAGMINVFRPQDVTVGMTGERILRLTLWVNSLLFLVNLLPSFPFDGKRIFLAGLALLWRDTDFRRSSVFVAVLGKGCGVVMLFLAWIMRRDSLVLPHFPAWFGFLIFGFFMFFSADRGEALKESKEHQPAEEDDESVFDWLEQYQQEKLERQLTEAEEEAQMETILARIHEEGVESLSAEERGILHRVSARYRERLSNDASSS